MGIRPFKVLVNFNVPVEIDQSLSWYNALLKMGKKLNDVIEVVNNLGEGTYTPENPPPYPVLSVNGKTGEIVLALSDLDGYEQLETQLNGMQASISANKSSIDVIKTDVDSLKQNDTALQANIDGLKNDTEQKFTGFTARLDNYALWLTETEFSSENFQQLEQNGTKLIFVNSDNVTDDTAQKLYYLNGDNPVLLTTSSIRSLTFEQYSQLNTSDKVNDYYKGVAIYAVNNNSIVTLYLLNSDGSEIAIAAGGGEGGAVTSVNGMTGAVNLTADSVGAPTKAQFSGLEARVQTLEQGGNAYSPSNPPPYPVTSVNGQTGDVNLDFVSPTTLQTVQNALQGQIADNKNNIDNLNTTVNTHGTDIGKLQSDYVQMQGDIANAQADAEEALALHNITNPDSKTGSVNIDELTLIGYYNINAPVTVTGVTPDDYNNYNASVWVMRTGLSYITQYMSFSTNPIENPPKLYVRMGVDLATSVTWYAWQEIGAGGVSDAYSPSNPPPYPVTSVNGKTGNVIIGENDYLDGDTEYINGVTVAGFITLNNSFRFSLTLGKKISTNYVVADSASINARLSTSSSNTAFNFTAIKVVKMTDYILNFECSADKNAPSNNILFSGNITNMELKFYNEID